MISFIPMARPTGRWFGNMWGKFHAPHSPVKKAILRAMGVASDTAEQLEEALAGRARREEERLLPASLVVSESQPRALSVNVPAELLGERAAITLMREDGSTSTWDLNLWDLAQTDSIEMQGRTLVRKQVPLPGDIPLGYHQFSLRIGFL